jgi:hypothetical protein
VALRKTKPKKKNFFLHFRKCCIFAVEIKTLQDANNKFKNTGNVGTG